MFKIKIFQNEKSPCLYTYHHAKNNRFSVHTGWQMIDYAWIQRKVHKLICTLIFDLKSQGLFPTQGKFQVLPTQAIFRKLGFMLISLKNSGSKYENILMLPYSSNPIKFQTGILQNLFLGCRLNGPRWFFLIFEDL